MSKLTPKQTKFIDEYMIDLNASAAAERAGYSKKTAYSQGQRLLKNVVIKDTLAKRQEKSAKKAGVTRDEIIADLKQIKDDFKSKGEYPPHALKSIEILNKMLGFNEPDKTSIEHKGIPPLFPDVNYDNNKQDDDK